MSSGAELVKKVGETLKEEGLELAKKLWARLRPKVEEKPITEVATKELAKDPGDSEARNSFLRPTAPGWNRGAIHGGA